MCVCVCSNRVKNACTHPNCLREQGEGVFAHGKCVFMSAQSPPCETLWCLCRWPRWRLNQDLWQSEYTVYVYSREYIFKTHVRMYLCSVCVLIHGWLICAYYAGLSITFFTDCVCVHLYPHTHLLFLWLCTVNYTDLVEYKKKQQFPPRGLERASFACSFVSSEGSQLTFREEWLGPN